MISIDDWMPTVLLPKSKTEPVKSNEIPEMPKPEETKEQLLEGERPGSPIIPALRKKLIQSNTMTPQKAGEDEPEKVIPKRSITQIGQDSEPHHNRGQSVTDLGVEQEKSVPFPEESKDLGKPPLAHGISYTPKNKKLIDGIEAKFQASRHKKFTVSFK